MSDVERLNLIDPDGFLAQLQRAVMKSCPVFTWKNPISDVVVQGVEPTAVSVDLLLRSNFGEH